MATTEKYTTVIELNSEQAKRNLDELRRKVESWKSDLAEAREKKMGKSFIAAIRKELKEAEKELKKYDSEVARTIDTLNNIGSASVEQIENAQKNLLRLSKEVPRDSEMYKNMTDMLDQVTQELENMKAVKAFERLQQEATGATKPVEQLQAELAFVKQTADNAATASVKQLKLAKQTAENIKEESQKGTLEWTQASAGLENISNRLAEIDAEQQKVVRTIDRYDEEIKNANKSIEITIRETALVDETIKNISSANIRDVEYSVKILNEQMRDMDRSSDAYKAAEEKVSRLRTELEHARREAGAQQTRLEKVADFFNRNWGVFTQFLGSITGLSMAIRKSVKDFAEMEEAMADTRKYTGLTDAAIRELNEDLKRMDTRTSRKELNQLAGAAGRLGKTSKQDILDFVEAGNMIKVALGDDLGEGAIDNVGKLAMAFGEDERMGLRGAMLATGSAINELAQNSSANAGYLVDFTARVAGFGKQLGLTQAQIMGFGAVMDENLLQDEMAATAFGNMLTKMQTDTAKFAKIAGMEIKAFADLLAKDANQAVLTLADRLKSVDGQTMMKMLDDMGLDGSRAVAVLATMADKIDDVRRHQERATEAYREGVSVQKEYKTMNETVEAGIEKAKKQFGEMAVELGERLLPVVRYAISSSAMLIKALSATTGFLFDNIGAITKLSVVLAEYVVIKKLYFAWTQRLVIQQKILQALDKADMALQSARIALLKIHTIALLAHRGAITKTAAAQRILNEVMLKNPVFFVASAVAMATVGIWKLVSALTAQTKEQQLLNDINKTAAERVAEEKVELSSLVRVARDENEQLDKRREAIEKLNSIIPGYNGQLDETTGKYTENVTALKTYNALLREKYRLEAAEDKLKELEKKRFQQELAYEEKMRQSREREEKGGGRTAKWVQGQSQVAIPVNHGEYSEAGYQRELTREFQQQNAELDKQIEIVTGIKKESQEVVNFAQQFNDLMENARNKLEGGGDKKATTPETTASYTSDADQKKAEQERKKREAEDRKRQADEKRTLREQSKQLKAETEERLATLAMSYSQGLMDYRAYLSDRKALQLEGIRERMKLYKEGTAERIALENQEKMMLAHGDEEEQRMSLSQMERKHRLKVAMIEAQFYDEKSSAYQNEQAINQAVLEEDVRFLQRKKEMFREGSLERMQTEWEIEDIENRGKMQREQYYMQQLQQFRLEAGTMNYDRLEQIETEGAKAYFSAMVEQGTMTQDELDAVIEHIRQKFAGLKAEMAANADVEARAAKALETARKNAGAKSYGAGDNAATGAFSIFRAVENQRIVNEQLKKLYGEDYENNRVYQEAKRQQDMYTMQQIVAGAQAAYSTIGSLVSAASAYAQACSDLEVARVTANYDKLINAAGKSSKKREKLEKERDEKIRKMKTEANEKAMKMEIAQAIAQTAMAALNAYTSAMAGTPYPANLVVAPIAAGLATAAGAIQIATIMKQHEAQSAGYYEGGFTRGRRYRREAGVVHEGEFVANHQAVDNPNILPFLNFLDQAQRNNTVGSLTAADVARSMSGAFAAAPAVVTPVVSVQADSPELIRLIGDMKESMDEFNANTRQGLRAYVVIGGPDGLDAQMRKYNQLKE